MFQNSLLLSSTECLKKADSFEESPKLTNAKLVKETFVCIDG